MSIPTYTSPPTPPSREVDGANQADFSAKANSFIDWEYNFFTTSMNTILAWIDENILSLVATQEDVAQNKASVDVSLAEIEQISDEISIKKGEIDSIVIPTEATYSMIEHDENNATIINMIWKNTANINRIAIIGVNR